MAREEIGARIGETAEYFGIAKLYERTTNSLSGGQKQLLNLASVMTMQPKVIILDEPTAQLDPIAAEKFIQMLHKINDELGTTVIISEHRLDQLLPVCSKAVVMKNGEILADDNSYKVAMINFIIQKNFNLCLYRLKFIKRLENYLKIFHLQ